MGDGKRWNPGKPGLRYAQQWTVYEESKVESLKE